jgi:hypothetical protein
MAKIHEENIRVAGMPKNGVSYTFEEFLTYINEAVASRRHRWLLHRISWIDYDDVSQIIKTHIFKKWDMTDAAKPISHFISRTISNQTRNIIRNVYTSYTRPCIQCPANEGGDLCRIYGKQCSECPVFKHWEKSKSRAHAINLAESYENLEESSKNKLIGDNTFPEYDLERFHAEMIKRLSNIQRKAYTYLYIENRDEAEAAKLMGYKVSKDSPTRCCGYRQLAKLKKTFIEVAKTVIEETEIT